MKAVVRRKERSRGRRWIVLEFGLRLGLGFGLGLMSMGMHKGSEWYGYMYYM